MKNDCERPNREWWPIDYCDEVMPTAFASPEGWLRRMPAGDGFTVASPYHDDPEDEAERQWRFTPLIEGQRIDFMYCDHLEPFEITVKPDGTFESNGLIDPRANSFWDDGQCGDGCPTGDTLEEFAQTYAESESPKEAKRVSVGCCYWSDKIVFSFTTKGDQPTLEQAGTA